MAKKISHDLNDTEKGLLQYSAGDLIPMLREKKDLVHVKQCAFEYYDKIAKEFWQVQVTVTRRKDDFLKAFQTEEMEEYAG